MYKTIIEWFDLLPPVLKKLAVENIEKRSGVALIKTNSLHNAIDQAFHWENSAQGHDFWRFLYEQIQINHDKIDPSICTTEKLNSFRLDGVVVKDYYVNYDRKPIIEYL